MPATKNTPSRHHPRRRNVTTLMVGLKNGHIRKNLTQSGEPQRYSWGTHTHTQKPKDSVSSLRCEGAIGHEMCYGLLSVCVVSQPHASVSQRRFCLDSYTCCHAAIEVADQPCCLTTSPCTDTGPTSFSCDPLMPGAWLSSRRSSNF